MRLIDADELTYLTLGEDTETPLEFVPTEFIEKAETVKAVPVSFLKRWFNLHNNNLAYLDLMGAWNEQCKHNR